MVREQSGACATALTKGMTECMRRPFIGPLAQEVLRRLPLARRRKEVMSYEGVNTYRAYDDRRCQPQGIAASSTVLR